MGLEPRPPRKGRQGAKDEREGRKEKGAMRKGIGRVKEVEREGVRE